VRGKQGEGYAEVRAEEDLLVWIGYVVAPPYFDEVSGFVPSGTNPGVFQPCMEGGGVTSVVDSCCTWTLSQRRGHFR
jgi:hypothetical protein